MSFTAKDSTRIQLFTVVPCILILSNFYYQLMHKRIALKGVLKFTLKQLQHTPAKVSPANFDIIHFVFKILLLRYLMQCFALQT